MNETLKVIKNRRSVRSFSKEQLKQEELNLILESAIYAPSSCNQQPWHFTVIQNKHMIDKLNTEFKVLARASECKKVRDICINNEDFHVFYNSPTVIIVSGEDMNPISQVDCAAATENILIAAESLGIGSCWIGFIALLFNNNPVMEKYKEQLCIPKGFKAYHAIALGYKKESSDEIPFRKENLINYIK